MRAGKASPVAKLRGDMKNVEGWILQMDGDFTNTQIGNKVQQLDHIGLYAEGDTLEWWKFNKHRVNT